MEDPEGSDDGRYESVVGSEVNEPISSGDPSARFF